MQFEMFKLKNLGVKEPCRILKTCNMRMILATKSFLLIRYIILSSSTRLGDNVDMPRYTWIVRAWSSRDGGWIRLFGYFTTEQLARDCIDLFLPMLGLHGDMEALEVVRTIRF